MMSKSGLKMEPFIDRETSAPDGKDDLRLWLRLLSCVTLIENEIRTRLRVSFDTTLPRFDYLAALHKAGGPLTMGDISKRLVVSNGNITAVTDRLLEEGLITRNRAANDRRTQYVELTAKGVETFETMAAQHETWIAAAFADLSDAEMHALMSLLAKTKLSARANMLSGDA
jgi:DNA-binding MarR family transcriptional regulator